MKKLGICPISSKDFLRCSIDALQKRHVLDAAGSEDDELEQEVSFLSEIMPDHLFPDCTVDLPLMGGSSEGITLAFDCYERCCLEHLSAGTYFQGLGLPAMTAPENRDDVMLLHVKGRRFHMECTDGKEQKAQALSDPHRAEAFTTAYPVFCSLAGLPLGSRVEQGGEVTRVIITSGPVCAKTRFADQPYKQTIVQLLAKIGVSEERLAMLDRACYNAAIPYYDKEYGFRKWISYMDVASFVFELKGPEVINCHAKVRISDKCILFQGVRSRRLQTYQWHITDICDQRCRHCYLFAEDAALKCVSTPVDQLMLTLEQITEDAARKGSIPYLIITGGDPILHPQFWWFVEELHHRGIYWSILGNPFHLDLDVCKRLYQLGCNFYQLSLDGLCAFHDYMRKPGSFDATIRAVKLLNDAGIQSHLMATVSRQNMEDVLACMDIAAEHHACSFAFARYCATSPEKAAETYPTPEEYRSFLLRYYEKAKRFKQQHCTTKFPLKEHLFTLLRYELGEFRPTQYSIDHPDVICDGCHLGQAAAILPNGDLVACRRMDSVTGNVKTDTIHNIVSGGLCSSYRDIRNIKKCKDCELLQWCRGCRAVGFNVTGDLQCEDPCCWK